MTKIRSPIPRRPAFTMVVLSLLLLTGCGGPKMYPVHGKVVFENGDLHKLAEGNVEFLLEGNSKVRAYGLIQPDGRFSMETLYEGELRKGALEGTYLARIFLATDDSNVRAKARQAGIDPRFLDFKASGLTYTVPTNGDLTVTVSSPKTGVGR